MNGKGSKPRPLSISYEEYSDNFDAIFGKKKLEISAQSSDTPPVEADSQAENKEN